MVYFGIDFWSKVQLNQKIGRLPNFGSLITLENWSSLEYIHPSKTSTSRTFACSASVHQVYAFNSGRIWGSSVRDRTTATSNLLKLKFNSTKHVSSYKSRANNIYSVIDSDILLYLKIIYIILTDECTWLFYVKISFWSLYFKVCSILILVFLDVQF